MLLDAGKTRAGLSLAQHADHARAGAKLDHPIRGVKPQKGAELQCVRVEARIVRVLIEHQPVVLQIVQPFHEEIIACLGKQKRG
ncbi:hypothetical protein SDC9_210172 [bioreactor metagenome]|uniref:Uncharacterized protein n=1 Tax=bioreactor metagenome TaxID=1076179 RepID=A0A645JQ93_9ZZZZ